MSDYMKNQGLVDGITGCRNRQRQLEAENERLETFSRANWAALQEAQRQIEQLEGALARADARCVKLTDEITNLNELAKERYCEMQTKIDLLQASCDKWASIVEFIDYE